MIESRLLQILFILLEKGSVTAPGLAEKFEVSPRTIYRDIDALSAAGVPVYAIRGKGGGIFIRENYVLDKQLFSDEEQKDLILALQSLNLTTGTTTSSLLSKLSTLFQYKGIDWLEIDFSDWTGLRNNYFQQLQRAILDKKVVELNYVSNQGEMTLRNLEPLKLVFKDKAWYLYAFCRMRQADRMFKISRIRNLQVSSENFNRESPKNCSSTEQSVQKKIVDLKLLIDKKAGFRVYEEFKDFSQDEMGNYIVEISFPDDESTMNYLFTFGDHLEIVEPAFYREKMAERIEKLLNKYRT